MAYTVPFFIDGKEVTSESTFDVTSPATGKVTHQCSGASEADAKAAVDAAVKALPAWRRLPPAKRRNYFLKAADIMESRKEELAGYMVEETGGAPSWADFNLNTTIDLIRDVGGRLATIEGSVVNTASENVSAMVLKEPFGVVLAIAPWNAPYILGARSIAFPMAVGNTVVFKASELSPRVMWGIVSCFHQAGIPNGVLNMIAHAPKDASAVTTALIANPAIKKINFTGSTGVGRIIAKLAGEHLKPVLLELGGKAPAIVWEDADLSLAAVQCTLGAFLHGGQICMSTERIIVHKAVRGQFEKELAGAMGNIFPAEGDAPVLITDVAVGKTTKLVRDALDKGASVVAGEVPTGETKARMRPIAIGGVTQQMDIFATESFGPSVAIYEVETEEEALRLANDTEYGLSSAVFTADLSRGLRFAREIEAGAVHINSMSVHDEPGLPHGGAKASGYGRFNASAGLEEWVRTKVVTFPI
ncbi:Aldehyde/histidinol dehydrogenase [Plectosphaerella plurivora]|uniref:Aldehyde/histidinol dehydrogenase n=1 Tax=Plectosphaerella plurivora TaxID=936078 RepID=A0A9P8VI84_9PEZI|nr:Aldehyde/histidinol dehydrogenase [Plectosphaerella plurivora]